MEWFKAGTSVEADIFLLRHSVHIPKQSEFHFEYVKLLQKRHEK